MSDRADHSITFFDDTTRLALEDMLRLTGFSLEELRELVDCGAFEPEGQEASSWTFPARSALIARRAAGLRLAFELDTQSTSLVLGLLERIEEMERRMHELESRLSRPFPY